MVACQVYMGYCADFIEASPDVYCAEFRLISMQQRANLPLSSWKVLKSLGCGSYNVIAPLISSNSAISEDILR